MKTIICIADLVFALICFVIACIEESWIPGICSIICMFSAVLTYLNYRFDRVEKRIEELKNSGVSSRGSSEVS